MAKRDITEFAKQEAKVPWPPCASGDERNAVRTSWLSPCAQTSAWLVFQSWPSAASLSVSVSHGLSAVAYILHPII